MQDMQFRTVQHPSVWKPSELRDEEWKLQLTPTEIEEIDAALRVSQRAGKRWGRFGIEDFPLPTLAAKLRRIPKMLTEGRGFVLLRGVPVHRYSLDESKAIYWGISSYLGEMAPQGADGEPIQHVEDNRSYDMSDPNRRNNLTNESLYPHSDPSEVVVLLCIGKAKNGGESTLASGPAIYNEMVAHHPEYVKLLSQSYYETTNMRFDDKSGDPVKSTSNIAIPVFSWYQDRLACVFRRRRMWQGMERRGIALSKEQRDAFLHFETLADSDEFRLDMDLLPGDIQFLNNYTTVHSRKAFTDSPEEGFKRLMLRIWISLDEPMKVEPALGAHMRRGWPLPPERLAELAAEVAA